MGDLPPQPRGIDHMISRLSLLGKINIIVALVFLVVTTVETVISVQHDKDRFLEVAKDQVTDLTRWYFDSLNTMMLTGSMSQRSLLREKLLARSQIVDARVIRGAPVMQQFGKGLPEEQPVDELDHRALGGESTVVVTKGLEGRELTVLTPFRATENTRGVNCLHCHDVPAGSVNGAIRVTFSLQHMDNQIKSETVSKVVTNLILFAIGMVLVNIMLIRWLSKPLNQLMEAVTQRASGNTTARVMVSSQDELGRLGEAFNIMADNVNTSSEREHQSGIVLQKKVDDLRAVMRKVTEGDFSVKVGFGGDGAIGELALSLQIMIDYLRHSIEEKHAAVELLTDKVGRILTITELVAEGDLTRTIDIKGEDAIAHLSNGVTGMIESLNNLVDEIQKSGINVNKSSAELSLCMSQVEVIAVRQAEETSNISVTATQISNTTSELMATMDEVATMAESATSSALHSSEGLSKLQGSMESVIVSAEIVAEKLEILDERARNISAVVTTIAKVADQTNLLSLNASVEAEKAGEYGRGFAVVATEIRRLADQAAISTLDIEQMVSEMQYSVSVGVETIKGFTNQVRSSVAEVQQVSTEQSEVISQVETMGPRFDDVHKSMQFQAQGGKEIHFAMKQLNDEAQQTVESLKMSSSTINVLTDAAHRLEDCVSKFKVIKGDAGKTNSDN